MDFKAIINNYVEVVTKKFWCFEGRTNRKNFWCFVLVNFVINIILNIIPGVGRILSGIFGLAVLCPTLGITARRLHDTGKSGWMQLIALIPLVGGIILLILCIVKGNEGVNKYGTPDEK